MLTSDFGNKTKNKVKKLTSFNFGHFSCSFPTFHAIRYNHNHKVRRLSFCKGGEEFISYRQFWNLLLRLFAEASNINSHVTSELPFLFLKLKIFSFGASLVAQWLRIRLPMQGTRVRSLVQEDPTCRGATKLMCHNY